MVILFSNGYRRILQSGQLNRKRNSKKANVEYRISNFKGMYFVYFKK